MRKSRREAALTRQRIVDRASVELRRNGIDSSTVSGIMSAAGLTHGAFYAHFESKDRLVEESIGLAIRALIDSVVTIGADGRGSAAVISEYLSAEHRDHPDGSCAFVALGSELARSSASIRNVATSGFLKLVEAMAAQFCDLPASVAKQEALFTLSTIIGAVTMARIVTDPKLSESILREARERLIR